MVQGLFRAGFVLFRLSQIANAGTIQGKSVFLLAIVTTPISCTGRTMCFCSCTQLALCMCVGNSHQQDIIIMSKFHIDADARCMRYVLYRAL